MAWVTQHIDMNEKTKCTLKCYMLHNNVWTIFSHDIDKLLTSQDPPSRNGDKSFEDGAWLPMWWGDKMLFLNSRSHNLFSFSNL